MLANYSLGTVVLDTPVVCSPSLVVPTRFLHTSLLQVSTEDLGKYNALAQQQAKKLFPSFNMSKFYAAENADPLVFCHFAENIQDQIYDQVERV